MTESFATTPRGLRGTFGLVAKPSAPLSSSGSKGPAATGPGSLATCTATGSQWSKWIGPTAKSAGAKASPTPLTPSPPLGPPKVEMPTDRPRPGPETSRPCGFYGSLAARPGAAGPRPSTRCAASSRPLPTNCAPSCVTSPSTKSSNWPARIATPEGPTSRGHQAHPAHAARRALSLEERSKRSTGILKTLVAETAPGAQAIDGWAPTWPRPSWWPPGQPRAPQERSDLRQALRRLPLDASSGKQERHRLNRGAIAKPTPPLAHRVYPHGQRPRPSTTSSVG